MLDSKLVLEKPATIKTLQDYKDFMNRLAVNLTNEKMQLSEAEWQQEFTAFLEARNK